MVGFSCLLWHLCSAFIPSLPLSLRISCQGYGMMLILLYSLCEVRNTVIDGESVSSLAHGFPRLGRIGSYVCIGGVGGLKHWSPEHMLLSTGLRPAFAMCGISSAVCLTPRAAAQDGRSLQTRGQQPAGDRSYTQHSRSHKKQGKAESSLGRAIRGKKKEPGSQGGQLSADSTSPPLCDSLGSLLNRGLAVCLFGW